MHLDSLQQRIGLIGIDAIRSSLYFAGNPSLSDQGGQLVSSLMSALGGGFDVAMLAEMVKRWQQALQVGRRKEILRQVQTRSIVRPVHSPPPPDFIIFWLLHCVGESLAAWADCKCNVLLMLCSLRTGLMKLTKSPGLY